MRRTQDPRSSVPVTVRPLGRQSYAHLYGTRWRKARLGFLTSHPLCAMCEADGKIEPATAVDHIKPHKGDARLFWDRTNWQGLCDPHHNSTKQRQEATGHAPGHDATGHPTDPTHPWAQQQAALRRPPNGKP